jgi:anaerobic selenocysteine-containing dehydrogenase
MLATHSVLSSAHQLNEIQNLYETDGSWLQWREEDTGLRFVAPDPLSAKDWQHEWPTRLFFTRHPANWRSGAVTGRDEILKRESVDRVLYLSPAELKRKDVKPGGRVVVQTLRGRIVM